MACMAILSGEDVPLGRLRRATVHYDQETSMTNHSKLAIALAIVVGTGSAGLAATKHPVHRKVPGQSEQLKGASAVGSAVQLGTVSSYTQTGPREPTYMAIQTQGAIIGD
jgi:hypothetical protein